MLPRHQLTTSELLASFHVVESAGTVEAAGLPNSLSMVGIALPKRPLGDSGYTCQVGISTITENPSFEAWRDLCPHVEPTDGKVSGVVVFEGDRVVAGYTASGNGPRPPWLIGVHPDHRRKGLAVLAVAEWFWVVPYYDLVGWPIRREAVGVFVEAHERFLRRHSEGRA